MGLGTATDLSGLNTSTDKMTTQLVDDIWLALHDTQKPYSALPQNYMQDGEPVSMVITTAGAIYDLKREVGTGTGGLNFVDVNKYTEQGYQRLNKGDLGSYRGMHFIESPFAKIWNAGTVSVQTAIKAAVTPGSGAPDPATTAVEGARYVGQPGATHSITVASTAGFAAGDMVTIHALKHDAASILAANGVGATDAPKLDDPMRQDVEIHAIVDATHLSLKEPYLMTDANAKGLETDLGGTVFGYVTKGQTVHSALFITPGLSSQGLIAGVAQQPVLYTPPAIDDYLSIYRVTYDFWLKYQLWDARAYHVAFLTGQNSLVGNRSFR